MVSKSKPRLLCVWEQGSDLGHLTHLRLPIEVALEAGFEVFLAARELHRVEQTLGDLPMAVLQAPFKQDATSFSQTEFLSYTHLIEKQCFSTANELTVLALAWDSIFQFVQADVVLFESSPTALMTSQGYRFKKVLVGNGFSIPPASTSPFAPFVNTPNTAAIRSSLWVDDARLLETINTVMQRLGKPELEGVAQAFGQADARFLMTWPLLDHFGARTDAQYLGVSALVNDVAPQWPVALGSKVFGYLQYFPALSSFLRDLEAAGVCALLIVRGLPDSVREAYSSRSLRFFDSLVDLRRVCENVAWVVHHGNHSTMATFMLSGVPQLVIPRHQEHLFGALRLVSAGCAAMVFQDQTAFSAAIQAMQNNAQLKQSALQVASRCTPFDKERVSAYMRKTYLELLGNA